jgi:heme oxygenase
MFQPMARRLREATRALHIEVERSALMHRLLSGRLPRADYVALLRSLQVMYVALEQGLAQHASHPRLAPLLQTGLPRSAALLHDIAQLQGSAGHDGGAPAAAARAYADHLHDLARHDPGLLGAHAYVRYLGDLSGGQAVARVVTRSLNLAPGEAVSFYDFGPPEQVARMAARLRAGLDRVAEAPAVADAFVAEACAAFERHRTLFDELQRGAAPSLA